jgi:hypothetical protein
MPTAAAPVPAVAPVVAASIAAPRPDPLGALVRREVASLELQERTQQTEADVAAKTRALGAKAEAVTRMAAHDPRTGGPAAVAPAASRPESLSADALKSWSNGFAQSPEFDEEHPEELSYRPFSIGPVLTAHIGNDHPVLARMQAPDTGRVYDLLDETERLFPLSFRPGRQMAELAMAARFNGQPVGQEQLSRLRGQAQGTGIKQRQVPTVVQR